MSEIQVLDTNVPALLKRLKSGEYLTPEFQRDFVWNSAAVISLINSIIDSKPIGMITLWEQEDTSDLQLEHLSIPDYRQDLGGTGPSYFGNNQDRTGRFFAILDGKQRSTAIALAFGGLRAIDGKYKHSGRYFLNVAAEDPLDRILYKSEKEIQKDGLNIPATAIGKGLFPLWVDDPDSIYSVWMDYTQKIGNPECYPSGQLPPQEEIQRRYQVLQKAFNGIINTKLAVYIVPKSQSLGEICEIFETLNTTGTKVSTVDLIHSWLYADTVGRGSQPILLRQEIDELGEYDGAVGWSSSKERPELIAQIAAAIHVALDNKPEPRSVSGAKVTRISSIKSPDLLAVPDRLWETFFDRKQDVAKFLGDMQEAVSGGRFSMNQCPYPASATIYMALRWYREFDAPKSVNWDQQHLDNLFRAFFWRNAFSTRYDQGFLTKVGRDIADFKAFLGSNSSTNFEDWKSVANTWLDKLIPTEGLKYEIDRSVSDGSLSGALRKAALLLLYTKSRKDVVDLSLDIQNMNNTPQLHHIFPRDWCANNRTGAAKEYLDPKISEYEWVNSPANLMPMARSSNLKWKAQNPSMAIDQLGINSSEQIDEFDRYFVDAKCLGFLKQGADGLGNFMKHRAALISNELDRRLYV
ncbi:DUF262 domain-containing protein [Thalassovita aquimarina]|uniref:DUF262 domain-containing protein n=1 Tax=Thalassovita aquimarina TaxID=2785917 RepID=A0ABS5HX68_9RHOB|nr:DUF262 domain-containing protein [Thalassovita aquimarina]MBR9653525.1 DUF262 domain-containing protein [Thalassovita aquimarina]